MKQVPTARLIGAMVVALFAVASSLPLSAQIQPAPPDQPQTVEAASLLPEAPVPQTGSQTAAPDSGQAPPPATAQPSSSPPASASPAATQPPAPQSPADLKKQQHDQAERDLKAQEKQRLLGVMPQFQVVMNGQAVPLTGGQKWRLALHSAIDPFYIGWAFTVGGGYSEIVDSNRGYGWGDAGYFKRVGANYADNVNGALIGNALLPQILHQDPRYFRKGTGPIFKRFLYAAESTVVCRGDNGKNQANVSNVLGNFISGGISNLYYPKEERGALLTVENGISVTLFGALGGQILEFGPDLNRLAHRKKKNAIPNPVGPVGDPNQARAVEGKSGQEPQDATPPAANPAPPAQTH